MILTDYYKFNKLPNQTSGSRIDCTASTESYPQFEQLRNKANELFFYVGDNTHTKAGQKGKSDLAITKTIHISSIYRPDIKNNFGYGDVNKTADALIFVFDNFNIVNGRILDGSIIEVFVARGYRKDRQNLYTAVLDDELWDDMAKLRLRAKIKISI